MAVPEGHVGTEVFICRLTAPGHGSWVQHEWCLGQGGGKGDCTLLLVHVWLRQTPCLASGVGLTAAGAGGSLLAASVTCVTAAAAAGLLVGGRGVGWGGSVSCQAGLVLVPLPCKL
jgi:hypothetical protein